MNLEHLLRRPDLWRGGGPSRGPRTGLATGFGELDRRLPGGGWPLGALVEILGDHQGIGELSLLLPALAALERRGRRPLWLCPPYIPYPPALKAAGMDPARGRVIHAPDAARCAWVMEQALRSGVCGAVLAWPPEDGQKGGLDPARLRRLQLAAEAGGALAVLFRKAARGRNPSPAALRLALAPHPEGLELHILKSRGPRQAEPVVLRRGTGSPETSTPSRS